MDGGREAGVVEPFELRFRKDHACCADGAEGGEVEGGFGDNVAFLQLVQEARGGAEVGNALVLEDGEECLRGGLEGGAVVEDRAGAEEAALD